MLFTLIRHYHDIKSALSISLDLKKKAKMNSTFVLLFLQRDCEADNGSVRHLDTIAQCLLISLLDISVIVSRRLVRHGCCCKPRCQHRSFGHSCSLLFVDSILCFRLYSIECQLRVSQFLTLMAIIHFHVSSNH